MKLAISEVFYSMQGEGITAGTPAVFVRLTGCNLLCGGPNTDKDGELHNGATWRCDTIEVWQKGDKVDIGKVLWDREKRALKQGATLIITGGEPMLQQEGIAEFIRYWRNVTGVQFPVEIETNGTIPVMGELQGIARLQLNCSPKLANSGNDQDKRIKPDVLRQYNELDVQYKFVISEPKDWHEIENEWLGLIPKDKVVLMPAGENRFELKEIRQTVAQLATDNHVHYCDRLHIVIWNEKTGV